MRANARRIGTALGCLAWLGLTALYASAQTSASPKILTKNAQFKLPIVVDDAVRVKILELKLYVKGPEGSWVCTETAAPTAAHFTFKAERDGEYQFTFATLDRSGRMTPSTIDDFPPHRTVVVDTTPPDLGVKVVTALNRETFLQVVMSDTNSDPSSVRMSCPTPRGGWQPMESVQPDRPGMYRIPPSVEQVGIVRVHAADLAGNIATRDFHIKGLLAQEKPTTPPSAPIETPKERVERTTDEAKPDLVALPVGNVSRESAKLVEPETTKLPDLVEPAMKPIALDEPRSPVVANKPLEEPPATEPLPAKSPPVLAEATPASPASTNFINTARCSLNYVFDHADPANPVKPEFWATRDSGRNWHRLADESNGRSPARLELPGEGLYGIAIRSAQNGQTPTPADRPDCWIEVDTSKPFVNLLEPTLGKDADAGTLLIFWTAHDKNLREDAITISYATRPEGPWMTLLQNHKNEGIYRWIMPTGLGSQVYLRMEATDLANNVGRTELRKPVQLDVIQPKVRVISVAPIK